MMRDVLGRPALMPKQTPDLMEDTWVKAMLSAVKSPEVFRRYIEDRGLNPVDELKKEMTTERLDDFVIWFNDNLWSRQMAASNS